MSEVTESVLQRSARRIVNDVDNVRYQCGAAILMNVGLFSGWAGLLAPIRGGGPGIAMARARLCSQVDRESGMSPR
jgi:hypothetical protein